MADPADIAIAAASMSFAILLGFSAHRASICTVRATAEVLSTGSVRMFSSFGKTVIWVFIVSIPVFLLFPAHASRVDGWAVSRMAMLGGFLFGVGAALNGGCAFSTIGRLCEGKMRMLLTLVGFLGGVGQSLILMTDGQMSAVARASPLINLTGMPIVGVLAICSGWALWELFRLWRTRPRQLGWRARIRSRHYRLSTAAFLMGVSNAFLYLVYGSWNYTAIVRDWMGGIFGIGVVPAVALWGLLISVIAGMIISAWERGDFGLEWRPNLSWSLNLSGGLLMGLGSAIIPGGNDVLILHQIPTLSPHTLVAYPALIVGIAVVLIAVQALSGKSMVIHCSEDVCTESEKVG